MSRGSVLITGASTGIGEACALRLAGFGFEVFAGVRKEEDARRLAEASQKIKPLFLDVTDPSQIELASKEVSAGLGERGLSGLVNNAGIAVAGPLEFLDIDDIRHQLEVNLIGQIAVTQAMMPLLRKARGRIVNIGSIGGRVSGPFGGPYSASKFALEAITDSLRRELAPWGMEVAIIEPGNISTRIWERGIDAGKKRRAALPETAEELYGPQMDAVIRFAEIQDRSGIPAARVARAVHHALTARRPKTRYLVGTDARAQAVLARILPDRVLDRIIEREFRRMEP
jgi:NAD(P)-dependent dehydrogenase (short-subunit alcohol dehydrogenase family)